MSAHCPRPTQIDARARAYKKLTAAAEKTARTIQREKKKLVALCQRFGVTPPRAEKTLRIEGLEYQAAASFGISTSYDQAAIARVATKLRGLGYPASFAAHNLFEEKTTYSLRPDWRDAIVKLPSRRHRLLLLGLLNTVTSCTPREPSLKVERRVVRLKPAARSPKPRATRRAA